MEKLRVICCNFGKGHKHKGLYMLQPIFCLQFSNICTSWRQGWRSLPQTTLCKLYLPKHTISAPNTHPFPIVAHSFTPIKTITTQQQCTRVTNDWCQSIQNGRQMPPTVTTVTDTSCLLNHVLVLTSILLRPLIGKNVFCHALVSLSHLRYWELVIYEREAGWKWGWIMWKWGYPGVTCCCLLLVFWRAEEFEIALNLSIYVVSKVGCKVFDLSIWEVTLCQGMLKCNDL